MALIGATCNSTRFSACCRLTSFPADCCTYERSVRSAASKQPNWLVLLDRLSPDFAPAGAQVLRALGRG